jgi:hypothetical protein
VIVHFRERPRKIELVAKSKLVTDLFDGQISGVEQLHGALHPQVIEIA